MKTMQCKYVSVIFSVAGWLVTVGENIGVKASGGVRCEEDAVKVIDAGASRIGASASIAIVSGDKSSKSDY